MGALQPDRHVEVHEGPLRDCVECPSILTYEQRLELDRLVYGTSYEELLPGGERVRVDPREVA